MCGPSFVQLPALAADDRARTIRPRSLPAPMIRLHKLGRTPQPFHLNPDLILTVDANPDTVVLLTTGSRLVVVETPEQVADAVRTWRASVLDAMSRAPRRSQTLALVRGTAGDARPPQPEENDE